MKDSNYVMYMFNMQEAQKKEKEDAKRNKESSGKDQDDSSKKILHNKRMQKVIHGEFESLGEANALNHSNDTLINKNIDNTCVFSLLKACKELESEKFKECNERNIKEDQNDSFEEEIPNQQQEEDIDGDPKLNKVSSEDRLPVNYGSKLLIRDKKDGNYHITQGIPRNIKFCSIDNLYKCTPRLSPVEDEYNWNIQTKEDSNMSHLEKEDASLETNKKNIGCKKKGKDNKNNNGEKDATTSSP